SANYRYDDPRAVPLTSFGEVGADLSTGAVRLYQPLDFDLSPGTDIGGNPALVYSSSPVNVYPIVDIAVGTAGDSALPDAIKVTLNWDTGTGTTLIGTRGYTPGSGLSVGNTLGLAVQLSSPVTETGHYSWTVTVELDYFSGPSS